MIPRAVELIWAHCNILRVKGWAYAMSCSFLEIYNETLRDLLAVEGGVEESKKRLEIKHSPNGTIVSDLTSHDVNSPKQVLSLLKIASKQRQVASTLCNERSSRSHRCGWVRIIVYAFSVFMLRIYGTNDVTGESCEGVLNLIDLGKLLRVNSTLMLL